VLKLFKKLIGAGLLGRTEVRRRNISRIEAAKHRPTLES
jgi:hypothetical protein